MPIHIAFVHVGVADAQAVDCFAMLVTEGATPPSDLDVVLILNLLSEAKKDSVATVRRAAAKPAGYRGLEPSVWNKCWRHTHGPDT